MFSTSRPPWRKLVDLFPAEAGAYIVELDGSVDRALSERHLLGKKGELCKTLIYGELCWNLNCHSRFLGRAERQNAERLTIAAYDRLGGADIGNTRRITRELWGELLLLEGFGPAGASLQDGKDGSAPSLAIDVTGSRKEAPAIAGILLHIRGGDLEIQSIKANSNDLNAVVEIATKRIYSPFGEDLKSYHFRVRTTKNLALMLPPYFRFVDSLRFANYILTNEQ